MENCSPSAVQCGTLYLNYEDEICLLITAEQHRSRSELLQNVDTNPHLIINCRGQTALISSVDNAGLEVGVK